MRKIAGSSNYLKNQTKKHLSRAILSLLLSILIFTLTVYIVLFQTQTISALKVTGFATSLIMLAIFRYHQRKYHICQGGQQGEKTVIKTLTNNLNDEYHLINGVYQKGKGDIDHIVLGPTGVYVLETKNWSGKIVCNGDQWHRPGKDIKSNPSLQVKHNTQKIKKLINSSHIFQKPDIWIEGVLVFTNTHANLTINNPTITILNIQQLPNYIKKQKNNHLTKQQIQQITEQIQNT
jgi:hypothetical protein